MSYNISYSFKGSDIKESVNKVLLSIINTIENNLNECDYDI